jgi:predicted component of type VI protein secretion system
MTLERVGKEGASASEEPKRVESVLQAFEQFQPTLSFTGYAGDEETEFKADFRFGSIKDFDPENLQKRQEVKKAGETEFLRNDIADLKSNIDLLYRLKDRWRLPAVRRAWSSPEQRREIIEALGRLRAELEKVAGKGGKS